MPNKTGVEPGWGARSFPATGEGLKVLASGTGEDGALPLYADGAVLAGKLDAGQTIRRTLAPGTRAYLVPAVGRVTVNGVAVGPRDGAAVEAEARTDDHRGRRGGDRAGGDALIRSQRKLKHPGS